LELEEYCYFKMESFLRDGVDLRRISGGQSITIAGDAHFFDDATSPEKLRHYLESLKVIICCTLHSSQSSTLGRNLKN